MTFNNEFKEAVSHLPSKEKDKLILRLLKKDLVLANRLYFELVDDRTVDQRRAILEERVKHRIKRATETFWSVGYLTMDMRYLSGEITEHLRITKDKYGEVSLNLLMLNEVLKYNQKRILEAVPRKARKISIYIIARAFKILILIQKLHPDYRIDFEEGLWTLGQRIGENEILMHTAINNGFDVNWLLHEELPENLTQVHADLRKQGFLK